MTRPSTTLSSSLFSLLLVLVAVAAQNSSKEYPNDPYLEYRPPFVRSLPVQILLTGIILTLVAVLFIHLMFTTQYHWALAPVNYVLQVSGVTTLLISLIATLHVVLSSALSESEKWPYMLSYIAVNVPPLDPNNAVNTAGWTVAETATWLVMNASTSGLIQITHIQFLTLMYPSRLEGRLIFLLLGPLAIVAAVMQVLPIHGSTSVNNIASAVKNVCNATLSLLFTAALFLWGFLINRKQAWRTDGGTAIFGCGALMLALISTALNFLYVDREQEYVWLPGLMWAVVLWQSFLGWWWWVGAGSPNGLSMAEDEDEIEEKLERLRRKAKRESRRREARERKQENKGRGKNVWKGVAGAFGNNSEHHETGHSTSTQAHAEPSTRARHHRSKSQSPTPSNSRSPARSKSRPSSPSSTSNSSPGSVAAPARSIFSYTATTMSTFATLPRALPGFIHRWYTSLRRAHVIAARQQAAERVERIREMERNGNAVVAGDTRSGWGLGSFGFRMPRAGEKERGRRERGELDEGSELQQWRAGRGRTERRGWDMPMTSLPRSQSPPIKLPAPTQQPNYGDTPRSVWWWGPLRRWRLQDSTSYN